MSNVISIAERKEKLRHRAIKPLSNVEDVLALLDSDFTENSSATEKNLSFIKAIKGILKSRDIKFRVVIKNLLTNLNKKTTILFMDEKIGFSLEVKARLDLDNNWKIYPLNSVLNPAENAGLIINKLHEVKTNG